MEFNFDYFNVNVALILFTCYAYSVIYMKYPIEYSIQ